jgi:hypothetical protein
LFLPPIQLKPQRGFAGQLAAATVHGQCSIFPGVWKVTRNSVRHHKGVS